MPYQDKQNRTCGFLDLETKEYSNHFVRRFVILDDKVRLLHYYMDNPQNLPDSSAPVGTLNMQYVSMVDNASWYRPKIPFSFYINVRREKHFFKAGDAEDRDGWIQALRDASKVVVTQRSNSQEDMLGMKTQIVGGVALKMPLDSGVISDSDISEDDSPSVSPTTVPDSPYSRVPPIKVGYCVKQGARMKNWKRRFFKLDEDGLSYFKSAGEKAPIRTICWPEIFEARKSIGIHINKDHVFEVVTPSRVFYIKTDGAEIRDAWISAITSNHPKKAKSVLPSESSMEASASAHLRSHPERNTWAPTSPTKVMPDFHFNRYSYK